MTKQEEIKNLTSEELLNIECHTTHHNPNFNFLVWASHIKEALEKKTGQKYYIGRDCQFHLMEE